MDSRPHVARIRKRERGCASLLPGNGHQKRQRNTLFRASLCLVCCWLFSFGALNLPLAWPASQLAEKGKALPPIRGNFHFVFCLPLSRFRKPFFDKLRPASLIVQSKPGKLEVNGQTIARLSPKASLAPNCANVIRLSESTVNAAPR